MEECPVRIDTSKPHPARVYDWLLGGKDNYPVDQRVGAALPEQSRRSAARNREFMHRAAAWLAARGVDQFLDIARARLDFDRPVALSLIALMHFLPDPEDPYALTRTLLSALPSGSYLVLS
ncbi:SAM-dependent methyltransferase, partial [Streptomyces recifensis]|uniref:SAM-dependent methyltransferase n=1 Tax=Streptomyces recifensis TaxID=67355 RepID=UPI001ABF23B8